MNVIVPAAGRGTRLRPLTLDRPKPLLHVGGGTLLAHALAPMLHLAVDNWVFVVGPGGDEIRRFVDGMGLPAEYVAQPEPLGQAHALSLASAWLDGPVTIVFPDMIFDADLRTDDGSDEDGYLFARRVEDPRRFGVVTTDGDGYALGFVEKPTEPVSDMAIVGVYHVREGRWLRSAIDEQLSLGRRTGGEFYLADALEIMIREGARLRVRQVAAWEDCGTLDDLLATNRVLLEGVGFGDLPPRLGAPPVPFAETVAAGSEPSLSDVTIRPPVHVSEGARVQRCTLGPHVHVGPECQLSGSTIGPFVSVGTGCRIEDSAIGPHVSLEGLCTLSESRLSDSVVGSHAALERSEIASSLLGTHVEMTGVCVETYIGDYSRASAGAFE